MNWFGIDVDDGGDFPTFTGSTTDALEVLVEKAARDQYIRLDNLLWYEHGDFKDWKDWDHREMATILINPNRIVDIRQYKADPRTISRTA